MKELYYKITSNNFSDAASKISFIAKCISGETFHSESTKQMKDLFNTNTEISDIKGHGLFKIEFENAQDSENFHGKSNDIIGKISFPPDIKVIDHKTCGNEYCVLLKMFEQVDITSQSEVFKIVKEASPSLFTQEMNVQLSINLNHNTLEILNKETSILSILLDGFCIDLRANITNDLFKQIKNVLFEMDKTKPSSEKEQSILEIIFTLLDSVKALKGDLTFASGKDLLSQFQKEPIANFIHLLVTEIVTQFSSLNINETMKKAKKASFILPLTDLLTFHLEFNSNDLMKTIIEY